MSDWTNANSLPELITALEALRDFCEAEFDEPGQPETQDALINGIELIKDLLDDVNLDITDINLEISNEATARAEGDSDLLEIFNELSLRFNRLAHGEAPEQDSRNGHRKYLWEFFELISTDQIDGYKQQIQFFTNALGNKPDGIDADAGTGITISISNPARPRITLNRPFWASIQSKPSYFPPEAHSHDVSSITGLLSSGKIISSLLPSYVDDVLEFANLAGFPVTGETGIIYIAIDTGKVYRWSGSAYIEIVASPGSTDSITEGLLNLYFTEGRVLSTIATGLSDTAGTMASSDSFLTLFGKIKKFITDISGTILNQVLTGLSTASGSVISSSDSIVIAIGKLQRQITDALASVSSNGFQAGDTKESYRPTMVGKWLLLDGKTIGGPGSGATALADLDAFSLYSFLWNTYPDQAIYTSSGVLSSRGADPLTDFNNGKRLALFDERGRFKRIAGISSNGQKANGSYYNGGVAGYSYADKMFSHKHASYDGQSGTVYVLVAGGGAPAGGGADAVNMASFNTGVPKSDGVYGTPNAGDETTPAYISLYSWIYY